jgi:hypothetical protein
MVKKRLGYDIKQTALEHSFKALFYALFLYKGARDTTIEPGYNDIGLYDTSLIVRYSVTN